MKKDVIVALVCLIGSIALYFSLGTISEETARTFPRVVIVISIILSALLLIQGIVLKRGVVKAGKRFPWGRFFLLLAIIIVYFIVMQPLGFYVSAFLFFVAVGLIVGRVDLTTSKATARVLQSALFTAILFLLFNVLLKVQTPRGMLF